MDLLPKDFVDLPTAQNSPEHTDVNIIGLVVDIMPPARTTRDQWMVTFRVLDMALQQDIYQREGRYVQGNGLSVRYFRAVQEDLPKVRAIGDVVLIRSISRKTYKTLPILLSNHGTSSVVFPSAGIPAKNFEISFRGTHRLECLGAPVHKEAITFQDQKYIIALKDEMKSLVQDLGQAVGHAHGVSYGDQYRRPGQDSYRPQEATGAKRYGDRLQTSAPKRMRPNSMGPKFRLVEDLRHYEFADLCVQVIKIFPHNYGVDLYVSDYTENPDMFYYPPPGVKDGDSTRDGDAYGYTGARKREWPGPYGKHVLKVNLKDPHASYLNNNVKENDFVQLKNVKMKKMAATLEGDIWEDSWHSTKINVTRVSSGHGRPEMVALMERKEKYWENLARQKDAVQTLTKTEKKKRKRQRKAENAAARAEASRTVPFENNEAEEDDGADGSTNSVAQPGIDARKKSDLNPHIRCSYEEVHISSIREINDPDDSYHTMATISCNTYTLPFINVKQRARVRCIDFSPNNLSDFAVLVDRNDESLSSASVGQFLTNSSQKYEWSFSLLLENTPKPPNNNTASSPDDRIWVDLGQAEAQYLLGNAMPDPCDLTQNRSVHAQLRERMYILWGNLAEKKGSEGEEGAQEVSLSNRPFECCIAEYGVLVDDDGSVDPGKHEVTVREDQWGWRRCHRMFGVTIL